MSVVSFLQSTFVEMRSNTEAAAASVITGGKEYESDIVLAQHDSLAKNDGPGSALVEAMRLPLVVRMPGDNDACYEEHVPRFDKALADNDIVGFVYHPRYEFGYIDLRMPSMSLMNLLVAALAIACSTSLFLPIGISFTLVVIVGSIDILLVGVLMLAGLRLNAITFVTLLVSLALAIDYSCHIGHAYEMADETTRPGKVRGALGSVGVSVLNGGLSTLLGTGVLSVSRSNIFRTFFLMVWSTIVLALLAGLTVVPAILCYVGPVAPIISSSRRERPGRGPVSLRRTRTPDPHGSARRCGASGRSRSLSESSDIGLHRSNSVPVDLSEDDLRFDSERRSAKASRGKLSLPSDGGPLSMHGRTRSLGTHNEAASSEEDDAQLMADWRQAPRSDHASHSAAPVHGSSYPGSKRKGQAHHGTAHGGRSSGSRAHASNSNGNGSRASRGNLERVESGHSPSDPHPAGGHVLY